MNAQIPIHGPRVFISYSHDSQAHRDAVLQLAQKLRKSGIDAICDRYHSAPPEGWPRWMMKQIQEAQFVLLVCTATFCRRFEGREEPGKGKGSTFEGFLAEQFLYEANTVNTKFIPLVLEGGEEANIPVLFRPYRYYVLPGEFEKLYRHLTDQPSVVAAPLGPPIILPSGATAGPPSLIPPDLKLLGQPRASSNDVRPEGDRSDNPTPDRNGISNNASLTWSKAKLPKWMIRLLLLTVVTSALLALVYLWSNGTDPPDSNSLPEEGRPSFHVTPAALAEASGRAALTLLLPSSSNAEAKPVDDSRLRALELTLKEERKGQPEGFPCKAWEIASVQPRIPKDNVDQITLFINYPAGGTLTATDKRFVMRKNGWVVTPQLIVPTRTQIEMTGLDFYMGSCDLGLTTCEKSQIAGKSTAALPRFLTRGELTAGRFVIYARCTESMNQ